MIGPKHGSVVPAARRTALRLPVARTGAVLFAVIVVLGVLGRLEDAGSAPDVFDLDGEGQPPAAFSALLLGSAGVMCLLVRALDGGRRRWAVLGGFLLFMAVDEALTLHETASRLTGVAWTVLYLPVIALGGIAWLLVLLRIRSYRRPLAAWLGGAAAWFVAQVLEELQSNAREGRVENYATYATFEETLELTGSLLWLLALLALHQWWTRTRQDWP